MNIGLFEDAGYRQLLPLTWLRACCELVCGRDRLVDKLRRHVGGPLARVWARPQLAGLVSERLELDQPEPGRPWCLLNARALVTGDLTPPPLGVAWCCEQALVAVSVGPEQAGQLRAETFLDQKLLDEWLAAARRVPAPAQVRLIRYPWELVAANGQELRRQLPQGGTRAGQVCRGAHLLNPAAIQIGPGATVKPGVVLDAEAGPICIERDATVQPNAVLEGPCYIGPGSLVRPGAVIRGETTIGPVCRVGGEIEATIIQGYSNKQHDGFLGHSYVAQWVNLGADTVNSDLKNTYGTVRVHINGNGVETGQQFVGAFIGDHAKTGIGTVLPTGCVIGVAASIFTRRALPKFVPSFAWLTDAGLSAYRVDKAVSIAAAVMARREVWLSDAEKRLLEQVALEARRVEAAGWS